MNVNPHIPAASSVVALAIPERAADVVRANHGVGMPIACGLAVAGLQILFVCAASLDWPDRAYLGLHQWDSWLYAHIAEHGYRSTVPPTYNDLDRSNVSFFPGYPLAGRIVDNVFGVSTPIGMLLAAQLAAWAFWTHLLLFCRRWQLTRTQTAAGVLAVLVHPAAFFLVVGYSESLFLAGLLGFLFWGCRGRVLPWIAAAAHGFVMTATRIAGLPLAMYPVFDAVVFGRADGPAGIVPRLKSAARRLVPCGVATLGGLGFFAFCQWRFGHWDLYLQAQRIGWQVEPDYLALLQPKNYVFYATWLYEQGLWPDDLSRLSVLLMLVTFGGFACIEWRLATHKRSDGRRQRIMFYLCALALFYIHTSGVASVNMRSMIRYNFGGHVLLVLAALQMLSIGPRPPIRPGNKRAWLLVLLAIACAIVQAVLAYRFTHGLWVA